jgi:hypothetical protein
VQAESVLGLVLGHQTTVEEVVAQRRAAIGLLRYPVDDQQPARHEVDVPLFLDLAPGCVRRVLSRAQPAAGDLPGVVAAGRLPRRG